MKKGTIGAIVLAIVIVITLVCVGISSKRVPAGYVAVQYHLSGGISGDVLGQGWHVVPPTIKTTLYSIGIEQSYLTSGSDGDSPNNDSFSAPSSDGKGLQMELTFTYRYDADKVADTFTRFKGRSGKELLDSFIKPNVISWTKEVTAKYPVADILGEKRAELNTVLSEYLAEKFLPYGIIIENASLINIEVDDETRASITKKVTAQQELALASIEMETAKIQAEQDKQVALINAEQAKIKAQGEADAKKIAAEGEAEANRKIAESLTPELIEKFKYDKWNGEVPQVQGAGASIIDISK